MAKIDAVTCQFDEDDAWIGLQDASEQRRISISVSAVHDALESVLDLGCGNGAITNRLAGSRPLVVGLDVSRRSLAKVAAYRVQALVSALPFRDRSFDAVTAFEVLEHLPCETLRTTVCEMKRVARSYIIISVPYEERLSSGFVKCAHCSTVYHRFGHYTSWSRKRLQNLFCPEFVVESLQAIEGRTAAFGSLPNWMYRAYHLLGDVWTDSGHAYCPTCKRRERLVRHGNAFGNLLGRVIWRAERWALFRKPAWYVVVYRRGV